MTDVRVLAIDLGTSRVKVGLVDGALRTLGSSSRAYATVRDAQGKAEQRPADWLEGIRTATREVLAGVDGTSPVDAVVLTAQMPTLVPLSESGDVLGNAVTWQDARADALVQERLDASARERVAAVAGTPIDGRYLIPMELRRLADGDEAAASLLSAKDYVIYVLTGVRATEPSTASGYGNFDLAAATWSEELSRLWGVDATAQPEVVSPNHAIGLGAAGAAVLEGVAVGTPVFVGAADSVCAHHYVTRYFPESASVIDGSSTVIVATLDGPAPTGVLVTPLVDPRLRGVELDLLATGSSVSWLADLFGTATGPLEEMALAHPQPAANDVVFRPYLARGEQGALWRSDVTGSIEGLTLTAARSDVALALYEGIAFETLRCTRLLASWANLRRIVTLAGPSSRYLGAALLGALSDVPVVAVGHQSPSLLGAALVAFDSLGTPLTEGAHAPAISELPVIDSAYAAALRQKAERFLAATPGSKDGQ